MPTPDLYEGCKTILKLGLCQVYTEEWAVEDNFKRAIASLEKAADKGADLAITPECVIHGYGFTGKPDFKKAMDEVAVSITSPQIQQVCELARKCQMGIVFGFAEKDPSGTIHNSAAIISKGGRILSVYRKVHCRDFERCDIGGVFVPGETFEVIPMDCQGGSFNLGTMICFDREITETVRCIRALGAHIVACPLATNTSDMSQPLNRADNEMITRCRAAENEVFIAVVNHAGRFNGGTFVVGPSGELILQMGADPEVVVVDLPIGSIPSRFHSKPLGWMGWGYRRPDIYKKYL